MAGSLLAFVALSKSNPSAAYFLTPPRFWELASGCLVYVVFYDRARSTPMSVMARLAPSATLGLLVAGLWSPSAAGVYATIGVVWLTAFLLASIRPRTAAFTLLAHPLCAQTGKISYSLYLWHWSVLSLARWTVGIHWWSAPILVALMVGAAVVSYRYVENPLRRAEWSSRSWKTISYGVAGLAGTAMAMVILQADSSRLFIRNYNVVVPPAFEPLLGSGLPFDPTCVVDGVERVLKSNTFDLCTVTPASAKGQTVFALGDSHAGALQGLLYGLHQKLGVGVHLVETPGVPFPMNRDAPFLPRRILYDEIMQRIRPGDVVLLARLYLDRTNANAPLPDLPVWYSDVEKLAADLSVRKVHVVIVGPLPIFHFESIGLCRTGGAHTNVCAVPRNVLAAKAEPVKEGLENLARRSGNIHVFEPFPVLCPEQEAMCAPVKDGIALFADSDHLNSFGARSLTGDFAAFLRQTGIMQ